VSGIGLLLASLVACGRPAEDSGACDTGTAIRWDPWGQTFFADYCRTCHSAGTAQRYGAPEEINFDSLSDVRAHADEIRRVVLEDRTMPVGGGVAESDLAGLDVFLRCGL
jgi:uncharacterized membrane protein